MVAHPKGVPTSDPQGGRHDRRAVAVTDGGGVDGDGDARRSETNDHARSMRLSTAKQKRAALLDLGHRSDHGDDGRRTDDDGLRASSDLGGRRKTERSRRTACSPWTRAGARRRQRRLDSTVIELGDRRTEAKKTKL